MPHRHEGQCTLTDRHAGSVPSQTDAGHCTFTDRHAGGTAPSQTDMRGALHLHRQTCRATSSRQQIAADGNINNIVNYTNNRQWQATDTTTINNREQKIIIIITINRATACSEQAAANGQQPFCVAAPDTTKCRKVQGELAPQQRKIIVRDGNRSPPEERV
eukprot:scaffold122959_cov17-Tisochrysis_lutea.AAC.2